MTMTGGCLCGQVRYETDAAPAWTAICYCRDCQRASGGGYMPVMGVRRADMRITGATTAYETRAAGGGPSTRHFCPTCGSLIFGGVEGPADETMSVYVGTLDDPSVFAPRIALFTRSRLPWDAAIAGVREFEAMPT
jgi:hypothetical protein